MVAGMLCCLVGSAMLVGLRLPVQTREGDLVMWDVSSFFSPGEF